MIQPLQAVIESAWQAYQQRTGRLRTRAALARRLGLSQPAVKKLFEDPQLRPSTGTLRKFARVLKLDEDHLLLLAGHRSGPLDAARLRAELEARLPAAPLAPWEQAQFREWLDRVLWVEERPGERPPPLPPSVPGRPLRGVEQPHLVELPLEMSLWELRPYLEAARAAARGRVGTVLCDPATDDLQTHLTLARAALQLARVQAEIELGDHELRVVPRREPARV